MRDNSISIRIEDYRENHDILEYLENSKYDALRSDKERKEERRNGGKLMWNDMRSSDGAYIIAERERERENTDDSSSSSSPWSSSMEQ